MQMENNQIYRFVLVEFFDKSPCWYVDPSDTVEEGDLVKVPYGWQELLGGAKSVIKCEYPYIPYDKPKEILSIEKKLGSPKQ